VRPPHRASESLLGALAAPGAGDVAQLVEHRLCTAGVEGSSPFVSTRSVTPSPQVSEVSPLLDRSCQPVACLVVPYASGFLDVAASPDSTRRSAPDGAQLAATLHRTATHALPWPALASVRA
jgi:hypothetical protein